MTTTSIPARTSSATPASKPPGRRVLDAPVRMFHWLFALSFLGAWLTADGERWRLLHVTLGYTMAGLLAFRLAYGLAGPRHAGLSLLWRKLAGAPAWLRSLASFGAAPGVNWRQGQNLPMALAVFMLLALTVPLTLSGYATYHDWGDFLGGDWPEELHEFLGNAFLAIVLTHLALIAGLSLLRRKNQAQAMLTGHIDGAGPDLVKNNRMWLAVLVLLTVLGFGAWQWVDSPAGLIPAKAFTSSRQHR